MDFPFSGVIPVDKPSGVTSRQVVNIVARVCGMKTVGHAGTLDPLAEGVVVVCVGHATRLVDFIHQLPKRYAAVFFFGRSSPSDDLETPLDVEVDPKQPTSAEIEAALPAFRGDILQRPCDYSAVHANGQRAYHLARKGRTIELAPKSISITRFDVLSYEWPTLAVDVECSTGTFIRALGRDLAATLETRAVMESLIRTSVGPFRRDASVRLDDITPETVKSLMLPPIAALPHLARVTLTEADLELAVRGGLLPEPATDSPQDRDHLAALDDAGALIGILTRHSSGSYRLRPNFRGTG